MTHPLTATAIAAAVRSGGLSAKLAVEVALARTASSVFDLLQTTLDSGERELQLVQSQEAIANPQMQFEVSRLR